jgi:hypothetical protein
MACNAIARLGCPLAEIMINSSRTRSSFFFSHEGVFAMPVNWGSIAGQLGSLGLTNLAKDAVRNSAEAEERRRADIRRQLEQERILAEARRSTPPPAAKASPAPAANVSMSELSAQLRRLPPAVIEELWKFLAPALMERVRRGEVSPERATALQEIMRDFDRARALPDLEDRTVEMNKVMNRLNAVYTPEQR